VAAGLTAEAGCAPLPDSVTTHPLWPRMVGPHWSRFVQILVSMPSGTERVEHTPLAQAIADLASELQVWLEMLGLRWRDVEDGSFEFSIVKWDLLAR
jgi:hypothetical protein